MRNFDLLTKHHLKKLEEERPHDYLQKVKEIKDVGKFLVQFSNVHIKEVREKPDFIIEFNENLIGLEHEEKPIEGLRKKEGSIADIFNKVEERLKASNQYRNIEIKYKGNPDFNYVSSKKQEYINDLANVVKYFLKYEELLKNDIVSELKRSETEEPKLVFSKIMGEWWDINSITHADISDSINKKETKIDSYIKNTELEQWLLIVIGRGEQSAFDLNEEIKNEIEIKSRFERIYLMEDFIGEIHRLK